MKASFTKQNKSSRRRTKEKDSFVGPGGLGSELKGLEYKPVQEEYNDVQEIQVEELHLETLSNVQDSFVGNPNLYGTSFADQQYQPPPLTEKVGVDCGTQTSDMHHYDYFSSTLELNKK